MATLIPFLGSCAARMSAGERRVAQRLEQALGADTLLWYDVPAGPKQSRPDFIVLHPERGLLILETRDYPAQAIAQATRQAWDLLVDGKPKVVINPLAQARFCALQVAGVLERDPYLLQTVGVHAGKLGFACGHGLILSAITRAQFETAGLAHAVEPDLVICQDEIEDAQTLAQRLWRMLPAAPGSRPLHSLQLERLRWGMFPQMRLYPQGAPVDSGDTEAALSGYLRVMDLAQEQFVRSMGEGHRVIHGVAGSGKTMLLCQRAEHLAQTSGPGALPILILCYSEPLAGMLSALMQAKGVAALVQVRPFFQWCSEQLLAFNQKLPAPNLPLAARREDLVQRVIRAVDAGAVPAGQYQAILVDEGHDFAPEWVKLITRMVDPATNSLLLLYDDTQSIYERSRSRLFSFRRAGVQAQGRTTLLRINHRNTCQTLETASLIAAPLLRDDVQDDDGISLLTPVSGGRDGPETVIIRQQTFREEVFKVVEQLGAAHHDGHDWGDMAIICRHTWMRDECANVLKLRNLPHEVRSATASAADTIKLLLMSACNGLEFAVVALPGVGHMPAEDDNEEEEARLFYIAATRATERLVITVSRTGAFGRRLG